MDSWKSDEVASLKTNNFLVVARTENMQARIVFENEIVKQMQENGFNATASYLKFGDFKPNETKTENSEQKIREMLNSEGFDGVILTIIKDYKEETRVERDGGYYAGGNYYGYYPRYYGGFYGYFYNPMSYRSQGVYVQQTETTMTSKLYVLETTVYNLKSPEDKQLFAIVTSQLDNPDSASAIAEDYVKKIAASLKD